MALAKCSTVGAKAVVTLAERSDLKAKTIATLAGRSALGTKAVLAVFAHRVELPANATTVFAPNRSLCECHGLVRIHTDVIGIIRIYACLYEYIRISIRFKLNFTNWLNASC